MWLNKKRPPKRISGRIISGTVFIRSLQQNGKEGEKLKQFNFLGKRESSNSLNQKQMKELLGNNKKMVNRQNPKTIQFPREKQKFQFT